MRRALVAITVLAGCTAPPREVARLDEPPPTPVARDGAWRLTWHGAPIGMAWEIERGERFTRRERVIVRRGDAVVVSELAIEIDRDAGGAPQVVTVTRWGDGPALAGRATATATGWDVVVDGEAATTLPPAVPFELAVRDAPRRAGFTGRVLLAGWGFAVAELSLTPPPAGDDTWLARLAVDDRVATARIRYDRDGGVHEVADGDGVVARATDRADIDRPIVAEPVEIVGGSAVPVDGAGPGPIAGVRFPDTGWEARFDPAPAGADGDRAAEIAALVRRVAAEVDDDLGATATTTGAALTASRGDCTTHALRFAALAARAGIDVKVVTGLRLDGDQLVRHRWNLAWTGTAWLPVDPTWAEAPATAVIALAVHGARAADLAAADATAFAGLGARAIALP